MFRSTGLVCVAVVLVGCGSAGVETADASSEGGNANSRAIAIETPPTFATLNNADATASVDATAAPVCRGIEGAHRPAESLCSSTNEPVLGTQDTSIPPRMYGVPTYALTNLMARENRARIAGAAESATPWMDGNDTTVRFRAPRGGRWRFTARGMGLQHLSANRGCRSETTPFALKLGDTNTLWQFHGAHTTNELVLEVQAERDEEFSVTLDGCPEGTACTFGLRAERVGALACTNANVCNTNEQCFIDPCDEERFSCLPTSAFATIAPGPSRAYYGTYGQVVLVGETVGWPFGVEEQERSYNVTLFDENGTQLGTTTRHAMQLRRGTIAPHIVYEYPPRNARRLRFSFAQRNAPSITIPVEAQAPVFNEGELCPPGLYSSYLGACREDLRCIPGAGGVARCQRPPSLPSTVTNLRAVRQDEQHLLLFADSVDGVVPSMQVTLLDWSRSVLLETAAFPGIVEGTSPSWRGSPMQIGTVLNIFYNGVLPRAQRVVVRDAMGSFSFDVPITEPLVVSAGQHCARSYFRTDSTGETGTLTRCGEGLVCNGVCAPPSVYLCNGAGSEWSPPSGGTHTITGPTRTSDYRRECSGGYGHRIETVFVPRVNGSYNVRFEGEGLTNLFATVECSRDTCPAFSAGEANVLEVPVRTGDRVRVRAYTDSRQGNTFTLRAVLPES